MDDGGKKPGVGFFGKTGVVGMKNCCNLGVAVLVSGGFSKLSIINDCDLLIPNGEVNGGFCAFFSMSTGFDPASSVFMSLSSPAAGSHVCCNAPSNSFRGKMNWICPPAPQGAE